MPLALRILLFISSVLSFLFVVRRLRKAQVQLYDAAFWFLLSALFVALSVFPQAAIRLSELIGIQSPVNLVYLIIIFVLLAHCFIQSLRFSRLEDRFLKFAGEEALKELERLESQGTYADKMEKNVTKAGESETEKLKKGRDGNGADGNQ